jgi:hypothetical protein
MLDPNSPDTLPAAARPRTFLEWAGARLRDAAARVIFRAMFWSWRQAPQAWRAAGQWKPGLAAKLPCQSFDVVLAKAYPVTFSIVRDAGGAVAEIVIQAQGSTAKSDGGLPLIYEDLGVALSLAIQGRDPVSGQPLAGQPLASQAVACRFRISKRGIGRLKRALRRLGPGGGAA